MEYIKTTELADLREVRTRIVGVNDTDYPQNAKYADYEADSLLLAGFISGWNKKMGVLISKENLNRLIRSACWLMDSKGETSAWWKLEGKYFELPYFKQNNLAHDYEQEGLVDIRYITKGYIYNWGRKYVFEYDGEEYKGEQVNFGYDFDGIINGFPFRDYLGKGLGGVFTEQKVQEYAIGMGNWIIGWMAKFSNH